MNFENILALAKQGEKEQALKEIELFIENHPSDEQALYYASAWNFQAMHWEVAEQFMVQLVDLKPNNMNYLQNIIGMYMNMSNIKKAIDYQKKLLKLTNNDMSQQYQLALMYHKLFDFENALQILNEIEKNASENVQVLGVIGDILHGFGKFSQAISYYERILRLDSFNEAAFNGIIKSKKFTEADDELLKLSDKLLNSNHLSEEAKAQVYKGLGKMYDDAKIYDKAWECFHKGNEIQSGLFPYNHQAVINQVETLKKSFTKTLMDNGEHSSTASSPILIVGMPRSGTTLLEQLIENTGKICAGGESPALNKAINRRLYAVRYPDEISQITSDMYNQLSSDYSNYFKNCHINGEHRSVDKLPGNFFHLGLLKKMFPNIKIINLSRNKYDCCLSIYFQMFANHMSFTTKIEDISRFYDVYEDIMGYWNDLFPENIFNLSYEDLVQNFELKTKELYTFLDLEWTEKIGDFAKSKNSVQTPSSWQVRQGINTKSINRFKNYEKYLNVLF
jgi:tetratricopeptide (TPR) repeat protein